MNKFMKIMSIILVVALVVSFLSVIVYYVI